MELAIGAVLVLNAGFWLGVLASLWTGRVPGAREREPRATVSPLSRHPGTPAFPDQEPGEAAHWRHAVTAPAPLLSGFARSIRNGWE